MILSVRSFLARFALVCSLATVVCAAAVAIPEVGGAAPLEFTCAEAGTALFSEEEDRKTPIYGQSVGTTSTLRNLLCFVGDPRCACAGDVTDTEHPKYEEYKIELGRMVGRCNADNPSRSLSGAVQEALLAVCKTRHTCVDETAIDPDGICPRNIDPVCGCDGRDYGNPCEAGKAGLTSWHEGECTDGCIDPDEIDPTAVCPRVYDPVCGCDDRTYGNTCEASNAGVMSWVDGACGDACFDPSKVDPQAICPEVFDPVCGCDGKEYSNACFAGTSGVTFWKSGGCEDEEECVDPTKINREAICPLAIDPVCGCDGVEYQNSCWASSAGLITWTEGGCE